MKRFLLLPALLAMFQLQAQQIEEYRYWINDDPAGVTVTGIGPNAQVHLVSALVLPTLTQDYNTITIQFKDTNDVYSVPVSKIFTRNTGAVTGYEYWIDDAIASRVTATITPANTVLLSQNIPLCLTAGTHLFTIRFQGTSGTWSVPITRQFTATASVDTDGDGLCNALDPCPLLANVVPGQSCDDNDACTVNDVIGVNCLCAGTFADADNDGTCDASDLCPGGPEPGSICDDGNANTESDVIGANCQCAGTPVVVGCSLNELTMTIQGDGASNVNWTLYAQGTNTVVSSGGQVYPNGEYNQSVCLADGCYYLTVTDGEGDGIAGGGYLLRMLSGTRIIDNSGNFTSGSSSAILNNGGFCLPLGNDRLITQSCDRLDLRRGATAACSDRLTADNTPNGTSGNVYQFWFYDPNGTLSLVYPSANGVTSNQVSMNQLTALVEGRLYNVRVRTRISAGVWREWGPACRMKIDNAAGQCPRTNLQDEANNSHLSCGQTKPIGNSATSLIYAKPKSRFTPSCGAQNANKYQFRFRKPSEGVIIVKNGVGSNPWTYLNMANLVGTPAPNGAVLRPCAMYEVEVRASFDGGLTWCHGGDPYTDLAPWGKVCDLYTSGCAVAGMPAEGAFGRATAAAAIGTMTMHPNPNRGDQLVIRLDELDQVIDRVSLEVYSMQGQRLMSRTLLVTDGSVNSSLILHGALSAGMYLVSVTAGDRIFTQRLVVEP